MPIAELQSHRQRLVSKFKPLALCVWRCAGDQIIYGPSYGNDEKEFVQT